MSSARRGRSVGGAPGVRFAGADEETASIAITLGDLGGVPLDQITGGTIIEPRLPLTPTDIPAETDTEAEAGEGLQLGGLQVLRHGLSNDLGATSRGESDADGPLDGPLGANPELDADVLGVRARLSGDESRAESGPPGVPGAGGRRHHRGQAGKGSKAGNKSKQQSAMRTWLRIDKDAQTSMLQADKWRITHKLGVQTRDLRLLDPNLSTTYPSAILCRDKAIVVNLEHLKVVITTSFVLVVNPEDERVARFITELKGRLGAQARGMPQSRSYQSLSEAERLKLGSGTGTLGLGLDLPFELRVLECCLDMTASHLDFQTQELEAAAYPALDALALMVSSPKLERVRRIKNNLVRLTTRVQTIREVLEKFLDDDSDMHDLNLTAKELREAEEARLAALQAASNADAHSTVSTTGSRSSGSSSSASSDSSVEEAETAVVEMLLETYFMHVDNTYNKLQTLHEYIGDTEDLVNIKLDQHRNQLITIDLILTACTTMLACMTVVGAWFGMNLDSGLQEAPGVFMQVSVISSVVGVALLMLFVFWLWRAKLIIY